MKTYPNQYVIKFEKKQLKPGEFSSINNEALFFAINNLSPSGLKLFLYLCSIPPKGIWYLSMVHATDKLGISNSSFQRAKKELLETGLLEKNEKGSFLFKPSISKNLKNENRE